MKEQKCNKTTTTNWMSQHNRFQKIFTGNQIKNCKINIDNMNRDQIFFGSPTPLLQRKMTIVTPPTHINITRVPLPLPISQHHNNLHLYMDFFFVDGILFLHTKSRNINFVSVQYCKIISKRYIIYGL